MVKSRLLTLITLLVLLLLPPLLSGCGSSYEPDERAYVLLIGMDKDPNNLLRISYLIAVPQAMAGGGEAGGGGKPGEGAMVTTISAPSIYASMSMVNTYVGRKISLMHTKGIIFSETLAKDGTMSRLVPAFIQYREARGTSFLAVSHEPPEEILELVKPKLEINPAKYMELLGATGRFTGFTPSTQIQQFYNEAKAGATNPIALYIAKSKEKLPPNNQKGSYRPEGDYVAGKLHKKGGVPLQANGAVAFREGKMVGELTGNEVSAYLMLRGEFERAIRSLKDPLDPKGVIAIEVSQSRKPEVNITLDQKGIPIINTKISLEGNILGNWSLIDYGQKKNRPILEKAMEASIKKEADVFIRRTQENFKSDLGGFGIQARKLALTNADWKALNWAKVYPQAKVTVDVDFRIRRTGLLLKQMPVAEPSKGIQEGENKR